MNTHLLNGATLGSTASNNLRFASATQRLTLTGALRTRLTRGFRARQALRLSGAVTVARQVGSGAVNGPLRLSAAAQASHWRLVRVQVDQLLRLSTRLAPLSWVSLSMTAVFRLSGVVTGGAYSLVRAAMSQPLRLTAAVRLLDRFTTTDAPDERTAGEVDLTTRTTSTVTIGDR